jgi:hypothetical protein
MYPAPAEQTMACPAAGACAAVGYQHVTNTLRELLATRHGDPFVAVGEYNDAAGGQGLVLSS